MKNRKGILAGRGADILYGRNANAAELDDSLQAAGDDPASQRPSSLRSRPAVDTEEALISEWTAMLEQEASAELEQGPAEDDEGPIPIDVALAEAARAEPFVDDTLVADALVADATADDTAAEDAAVGSAVVGSAVVGSAVVGGAVADDALVGDLSLTVPAATVMDEKPSTEAILPEWSVPGGQAGELPQGFPEASSRIGRTSSSTLPALATTMAQASDPFAPAPNPALSDPIARAGAALDQEPETPPSPMYVEMTASAGEALAPLPAPREKPEATNPAVHAQMMSVDYGAFAPAPLAEERSPEEATGPLAGPPDLAPALTGRERGTVDYLGLRRRDALWNEITDLYERAADLLMEQADLSSALKLLQEAQGILLESPQRYDVAQYNVGQVRSAVNRRAEANRWAKRFGWPLFVYELVWLLALGGSSPVLIARCWVAVAGNRERLALIRLGWPLCGLSWPGEASEERWAASMACTGASRCVATGKSRSPCGTWCSLLWGG